MVLWFPLFQVIYQPIQNKDLLSISMNLIMKNQQWDKQ